LCRAAQAASACLGCLPAATLSRCVVAGEGEGEGGWAARRREKKPGPGGGVGEEEHKEHAEPRSPSQTRTSSHDGPGLRNGEVPAFPSFFIPSNFNLSFDYSTPQVLSYWTYSGRSNHIPPALPYARAFLPASASAVACIPGRDHLASKSQSLSAFGRESELGAPLRRPLSGSIPGPRPRSQARPPRLSPLTAARKQPAQLYQDTSFRRPVDVVDVALPSCTLLHRPTALP